MRNQYSKIWFDTFLRGMSHEQTCREAAFVARMMPLPEFHRILDVCCGFGRHVKELARLGYALTGIDHDESAIATAREEQPPNVSYLHGDMRDLASLGCGFDGTINLWSSWGYDKEDENLGQLRAMRDRIRSGGRLILDVYNREYFETAPADRKFFAGQRAIHERKKLSGNRLSVLLRYGDTAQQDEFDWHVYTPAEMANVADRAGLRVIRQCTGFDEHIAPSPRFPRMQAVLTPVA